MTPAEEARRVVEEWLAHCREGRYRTAANLPDCRGEEKDDLITRLVPVFERAQWNDAKRDAWDQLYVEAKGATERTDRAEAAGRVLREALGLAHYSLPCFEVFPEGPPSDCCYIGKALAAALSPSGDIPESDRSTTRKEDTE